MSRSVSLPRSFEGRLLLLALALALLSLLGVGESSPAHLRLERSEPAADSEVGSDLSEIRLFFSQTPEVAVSRIAVEGAEGEVELGEVTAGPDNSLVVALREALAPAGYTVTWRTSSGDGHPIRGTFDFTVAATRR